MGQNHKDDGSPVTAADFAADRVIADGLARIAPGIPVVSEERTPPFATPYDGVFFLVDPLDGTKEYVAGRSDYGVNIALIHPGEAVAGVIAAPAIGVTWRGHVGGGAERLTLVGSRPNVPQSRHADFRGECIAMLKRAHLDEEARPSLQAVLAALCARWARR